MRAFAKFSSADSARAAERILRSRSSGGNCPSGSTSRSRRWRMAARAASAWSSRDIGRDHRVLAAICARSLRCSGVTPRRRPGCTWTARRLLFAAFVSSGCVVPAGRDRPRCRPRPPRLSTQGSHHGLGRCCRSDGPAFPDLRGRGRRRPGPRLRTVPGRAIRQVRAQPRRASRWEAPRVGLLPMLVSLAMQGRAVSRGTRERCPWACRTPSATEAGSGDQLLVI